MQKSGSADSIVVSAAGHAATIVVTTRIDHSASVFEPVQFTTISVFTID